MKNKNRWRRAEIILLSGLILLLPILTPGPVSGKQESGAEIMVPLLLGQSFEEAGDLLAGLGLRAKRLSSGADCSLPGRLNRVQRQYPEAGTMLPRGGEVGLYTCPSVLLNPWRETPDLTGLTLAQARRLAQSLQLKLKAVYKTDCFEPFLGGAVIAQEPEARAPIRRNGLLAVSICGPRP
ncbi:MAG: PASTA domain-containing protein [Desulfarculales bacterium]|nr:PASTA domain-containing protein [Desulfarculales bacterium]